jgi:hypothetical protein
MMHTVTAPPERDLSSRDLPRDLSRAAPRPAAGRAGRPPDRPPVRLLRVAVDEEWFGAAGEAAAGHAVDAPGSIADPAPWRPFLVSLAVATLWHAPTVLRAWLAID